MQQECPHCGKPVYFPGNWSLAPIRCDACGGMVSPRKKAAASGGVVEVIDISAEPVSDVGAAPSGRNNDARCRSQMREESAAPEQDGQSPFQASRQRVRLHMQRQVFVNNQEGCGCGGCGCLLLLIALMFALMGCHAASVML